MFWVGTIRELEPFVLFVLFGVGVGVGVRAGAVPVSVIFKLSMHGPLALPLFIEVPEKHNLLFVLTIAGKYTNTCWKIPSINEEFSK